jgi:hypothetical protein
MAGEGTLTREEANLNPSELWDDAVAEYNRGRAEGEKLFPYRQRGEEFDKWMDGVIEEKLTQFKDKRDPRNLGAKVRTWLRKACNAVTPIVETTGSAASLAFPPASVISQALVHILAACKNVSEQLDNIVEFYERVRLFFERISLLTDQMPQAYPFWAALTRVFCAILNICKVVRTFVSKGRVIAFWKALIQDSDVGKAYQEYNDRMDDLESSIIVATLGTVTETGRVTKDIKHNTDILLERVDDIRLLQLRMASSQRQPEEKPEETRGSVQSGSHSWMARVAGDAGSRNFRAFASVLDWAPGSVLLSLNHKLNEMNHSYIVATSPWVENSEGILRLLNENPDEKGNYNRISRRKELINVTGGPDTGKSMLASYIFDLLKRKKRRHTSTFTVYFNASDDSGGIRTFWDMLACCAIQVAEEDKAYRKMLLEVSTVKSCDHGGKRGPIGGATCIECLLATTAFQGEGQLILVLDGIDDMEREERRVFMTAVKNAYCKRNSTIRLIAATESPDDFKNWKLEDKQDDTCTVFEINMDRLPQHDLELFAADHIYTLPKLRRREETKRDIASSKAITDADSKTLHTALHILSDNDHINLSC